MSNLIPEGYYDAVAVPTTDESGVVAYARFGLSEKDTKQVSAHFKIMNPPAGVTLGFPLSWYGYLSKDAAKRTCESLRYMGLKGDDLGAAEEQELNQIVSVKIGHNTWEGKTTARVEFVNAAGGGVVKLKKPMGKDQVRQFAAMMRESMGRLPEVNSERATAGQPPPSESQSDGGFGGDNGYSGPMDDHGPVPF